MRIAILFVALLTVSGAGRAMACDPVSIYAAASTTDAVRDIAEAFTTESGCEITTVFAGSSTLAKQIEAGAPASIFLSANESWMEELAAKSLTLQNTRSDLLSNELVLITTKGEPFDFRFSEGADLAAALEGQRLALANPDGVPAGIYAKQALTAMNLWDGIKKNVVFADDVRAALAWVARGEARAGIVYRTDARITPDVEVVAAVPAATHDQVNYPVSLIAGQENPTARDFLAYLKGPSSARIFAKYGFAPLEAPIN